MSRSDWNKSIGISARDGYVVIKKMLSWKLIRLFIGGMNEAHSKAFTIGNFAAFHPMIEAQDREH
jgi:hypothetical protein